MIITRFAPSPTGELHIGGARAALYEYLAARTTGGKFLLRIEDTDRTRFVEGSDERIIFALNWLGLVPDNVSNIVFQSKRLDMYREQAHRLVASGDAYVCTCSKEKLDADRASMEAAGKPTMYDRTCREKNIGLDQVKEGEYVIRMKVPLSGKLIVPDLIRGDVEFDLSLIDDQVIMKSDGYPTYYLAAAVDDHDMGITHVFRGEEWLSSTPKSLILNKMLGYESAKFAHMPMVLAPDRSKLSKRHGATSVVDYKDLGYLPEAILNFLVLQGWNAKDDREFFTLDELETEFTIQNINKAPAIFDINKLNNINAHYIVEKVKSEKPKIAKILEEDFGVIDATDAELDLIGRGGYDTLKIAAEYILTLRIEPEYEASILVFKKSDQATTEKALNLVSDKLVGANNWSTEGLQELLSAVVSENELTNGDVFWPVRVALSGAERSPSPVELMIALGKQESMKRISVALNKLKTSN